MEELVKKRFKDLADKAYRSSTYTFTGFLGLSEMSSFYEMEKEITYVPAVSFGGSEGCERVILRFGSEELFGYTEDFPIACLKIKPLMQKFADDLGHRDFLGALMNLGIERSVLGDIIIKDNEGYLFCIETIAPYIIENLSRVKHTPVLCERTGNVPAKREEDMEKLTIQISSERIDAVAAKVYRLSRNESIDYFRQKKVFVNGKLCENNSYILKEKDMVTLRGLGKFIYTGRGSLSRKGKINTEVLKYGLK